MSTEKYGSVLPHINVLLFVYISYFLTYIIFDLSFLI